MCYNLLGYFIIAIITAYGKVACIFINKLDFQKEKRVERQNHSQLHVKVIFKCIAFSPFALIR